MKYITTREIAKRIGVTKCRVQQIIRARGLKPDIKSHTHLYREDRLSEFARRPPGWRSHAVRLADMSPDAPPRRHPKHGKCY